MWRLVVRRRRFGRTCCLILWDRKVRQTSCQQERYSTFLRNVEDFLSIWTGLHQDCLNVISLLVYFRYSDKIKSRLMRHPCCLWFPPPVLTFECLNKCLWIGMYAMASEPISTAYFINSSHQSLYNPCIVARQRLGILYTPIVAR
jgi:hypothetical protein